jgi:TldD protein
MVGRFRSGIEDPKGWGIQIVSQYGEEIRNGKLTGRVYSPVTLSGYVPDVLRSVDAVGEDFALGPGNCGKGSKEWVPVGMGGPHLRFRARVS